MNEWITTVEIADACQINRRNISLRAVKENWVKRPRAGRGGGFEYEVSSLPEDIKFSVAKYFSNELAKESESFSLGKNTAERVNKNKQLDEQIKHQVIEHGAVEFNQLTGKSKSRAEAKLIIIASWKQFIKPYADKKQKLRGEELFAEEYNERRLMFDAEIYRLIPNMHTRYPRRWLEKLETKGAGALGGEYKAQKTHLIDANESLQAFCLGMFYNEPDIQATNLYEATKSQIDLNKLTCKLPSISAFRRWLLKAEIQYSLAIHKIRNPDDFKNRKQVAWGNASENVTHINQLWELDSTPSDVMLKDGRHSIICAIDVFSRRPVVIVHPTSSAEAVCILLRKALINLGVPETVKTDNGRDYTSKRVMGVLSTLDIEQVLTKPFAGDEKPHVERFFKTWSHGISTLLNGYLGHNVAERQKRRARKSFASLIMAKKETKGDDGKIRVSKGADVEVSLSSEQLEQYINEWIEQHYMHRTHRTLGTSPFDKWQSQRTTIKTIENERALDVLLSPVPAAAGRPAGIRTVNKDVGIVIDKISYFDVALGEFVGSQVYCAWDAHDVGQIYVFETETMRYICTATNAQLLGNGISLGQLSREARRQQNAVTAEQNKVLRKAASNVSLADVALDVLAASKQRNGSLGAMPHPKVTHDTEAMRGAAKAVEPKQNTNRMDSAEFAARRQAQIEYEEAARMAAEARPRFRNEFEQFMWLLREKKRRGLTDEEIVIIANYRQSNPTQAKMADRLLNGGDEKKKSRH